MREMFQRAEEVAQRFQQGKAPPDDSFEVLGAAEINAAKTADDFLRRQEELMKKHGMVFDPKPVEMQGSSMRKMSINDDDEKNVGEVIAPLAMAYADQEYTVRKYMCNTKDCKGIVLAGKGFCNACFEKKIGEDPHKAQEKLMDQLMKGNPAEFKTRETGARITPQDRVQPKYVSVV